MYDPTEQDYLDIYEDYPEPTAEELEEQYREEKIAEEYWSETGHPSLSPSQRNTLHR
mgnify:FL=1